MNATAGMEALTENATVDIRVGTAVFVGFVAKVAGNLSTILMDGQIRAGSLVSLSQEERNEDGKVQSCRRCADGLGFELMIQAAETEFRCVQGFEWPGHSFSLVAAAQ